MTATDLFRQPVAAPALRPASDEYLEGWRIGRRAARLALAMLEAEAERAGARGFLGVAVQRVDAIDPPTLTVSDRAERLANAIRAALALNDAAFGPEAVAVLKDALR